MYYCSLKFILILIVFNCRCSSSYEDLDNESKPSKIHAVLTLCIGGGILAAMFLLVGVIILLYCKVAKALKASKSPVCFTLKSNPLGITPDNITAGTSVTAGSYSNLQCCDDCNLYADFDSLPPCFCDVNEGL